MSASEEHLRSQTGTLGDLAQVVAMNAFSPAVVDTAPESSLVLDMLVALSALSDQGIWAVDADYRTVLINDRMRELIGASCDRDSPHDAADEGPPRRWLDLLLAAAEQPGRFTAELALPDGDCRPLRVSGARCRGGWIGVFDGPVTASERGLAMAADAFAESLTRKAELTPREAEVLRRLVHGDRVPQLARALCISNSTVRNHLSAIFYKTGTSSQQDLMNLFAPV